MNNRHSDQESDQGSNIVCVNLEMSIPQSRQEPGLAILERDYVRQIERLERCKPRGWSDLWLAGGGIGSGLAASALVTVISLDTTAHWGTKAILWMLIIIGVVIAALSFVAYFTQRHDRGKEIDELKIDMEMQRKRGREHSCPRCGAEPGKGSWGEGAATLGARSPAARRERRTGRRRERLGSSIPERLPTHT
jgi:hypothetical protein